MFTDKRIEMRNAFAERLTLLHTTLPHTRRVRVNIRCF